jgi:hypothetical protein
MCAITRIGPEGTGVPARNGKGEKEVRKSDSKKRKKKKLSTFSFPFIFWTMMTSAEDGRGMLPPSLP